MELRQLRYFVAVAEEGHITRAAERLGIQQPPLSRQIKAIEHELDVQLFRRKARGVELTDAGRAFLDDAREILADLDQTFESTRRTARGEQGRICVGITPSASFHPLLPHAIRSFREAFPLVSLTLEQYVSKELINRLREEQMDVAFIRTSFADPEELIITPLLDEPMVVVLPDGHALTGGRAAAAISLKQLANEAFILGEPGTGTYEATIAACRASGFSPQVAQRVPRPSVDPTDAYGGRGVSAPQGLRTTDRSSKPGIAPRGPFSRSSAVSEPREKCSQVWPEETLSLSEPTLAAELVRR
jgi:DNA-binding transcriptional LysR family regulator